MVRRHWQVIAVVLFVLALVALQWDSRQAIVESQRGGCVRSALLRVELASVIYASIHTNETLKGRSSSQEIEKARARQLHVEQGIIATLAAGVDTSEAHTLPKALRHYATFSCTRAYPDATPW